MLSGELDGLHRRDLVVAGGVLRVDEWVMMREVDLAVEEVRGLGEGFRDIGEHVHHGLVDTRPVRVAVQPLAVLGERREVDGLGNAVPAEVGQLRSIAEPVVEGCVLLDGFGRRGACLTRRRRVGGADDVEV